jgi:hypothetical protein
LISLDGFTGAFMAFGFRAGYLWDHLASRLAPVKRQIPPFYGVFERSGHRFAQRKRVKTKGLEPGSDAIRTGF